MILIDGFPYDVSLTESHERKSETTRFPVEEGSDLSDHVRNLNIIISISGVVSDTPIGEMELLRELDGGAAQRPSDEARARLIALRDERRNTTIVTSAGVYENVVMTSFVEKQGPEFTNGLFFDCTFEQRRIVTSARASVRVAVPRVASKTSRGPQPLQVSKMKDAMVMCNDIDCVWFDPDVGAWRKSAHFSEKGNSGWVYVKGPLAFDGFKGTDAEIRNHVSRFPKSASVPGDYRPNNPTPNAGQSVKLDPKKPVLEDPTGLFEPAQEGETSNIGGLLFGPIGL